MSLNSFIRATGLSLIMLLYGNLILCQTIDQQVLASSGNISSNVNVTISWTIGEPVTETFAITNNILTQGFQQSRLTVTAIDDLYQSLIEITVYPNPFSHTITLEQIGKKNHSLRYGLYATKGNLLIRKNVSSNKETIDLEEFDSAVYLLKVYSEQLVTRTYRIVKL